MNIQPDDAQTKVPNGKFVPSFLGLLIPVVALFAVPFMPEPTEELEVWKILRQDAKAGFQVSVQVGKIACNPWRGYKNTGFTSWGIWSFTSSSVVFNCGPGPRDKFFSISVVSQVPFGDVIMRSKGRHVRTVGRYEYFEDSQVAGRLLDELIVFSDIDGKRIVVRRPLGSSPTSYVAYRMLDEKVELSYSVSRQPDGNDLFFENDQKILAFVKSVVTVAQEN